MDEIEKLKLRIGILETAVCKMIDSEMAELAPYVTKRWMDLDSIKNEVYNGLQTLDI